MFKSFRPWMLLPAPMAHSLAPWFLRLYGSRNQYQTLTWKPFTWRNLQFTNRLGLAGGADKNCDHVKDWWTLGPGFVEVGTVTPKSQSPNPGEVMARDVGRSALWNKMGFPNHGADSALKRLSGIPMPHFTPLFVNIGKNRTTPNENAAIEYLALLKKFEEVADAFVINISSPNTEGLRGLQGKDALAALLGDTLPPYRELGDTVPPVLLKLSPDMSETELRDAINVSGAAGVDGWILTNTTQARPDGIGFPKEGGLSGKPLATFSKAALKIAVNELGTSGKNDRLLVSAGGIMTPPDVFERLEMGADLVEAYTALIFNGPFFFREVHDFAELNSLSN